MAVIRVTSLADVNTAGKLTLRQAIALAADGDTIVFAASLSGGVTLNSNLNITKSVTIDGSQGPFGGLGGHVFIGGSSGSIIVRAGADVTLAHLQVNGGTSGAPGVAPGLPGDPGEDGTTDQGHGTTGGDGGNGGRSTSPGFIGSPALINQGTLTLDHTAVSGGANGGAGRDGGAGGSGGFGGNGTSDAGDGGAGGNGGRGSNGASAVGGILNEGALVLRDSAIRYCSAIGGDGGDGGDGGWGGQGGMGGPGGHGGAGGNGGNGGSGGAAIAGILNNGTVTIEGAALAYGNSAEGGVGGAAGLGGAGGLQGHTGSGAGNGLVGADGGDGARGSTGSAVIYDGAGPVGGHFSSNAFFEWGGSESARTISPAASGGQSFRSVLHSVLREGQITDSDTVRWQVSGGGLTAADFTGGQLPGGTLNFTSGMNSALALFSFATTFSFTGSLTFTITLSSPGAGNALGTNRVFTETLFAATAGRDTLTGTTGADSLDGGRGDDLIVGNGSNDLLYGNLGSDGVWGGAGDDQIVGGGGADRLGGGAGRDTFVFYSGDSTNAARDTITDFRHAEGDRISFLQAHAFAGRAAFGGTAGEIRYGVDAAQGRTLVYFDANGDRVADSVVILTGIHTLVAGDFGL